MGRCSAQTENHHQGKENPKGKRDTHWRRITGGDIEYPFQTKKTSIGFVHLDKD